MQLPRAVTGMYNFHPVLSSFPFALLSVCVLLEMCSFFRADQRLQFVIGINLSLAGAGALAAFFSGYQAAELANQSFSVADELISQHHSYGRLLLFAILPCLALKYFSLRASFNKRGFRYAYLGFLAISFGLIIMTGFLGANLVFAHGAGVKLAP